MPQHYHKNPREITEKEFKDLRRWLKELGDLSGIVHDLNSDEFIGGNQRVEALGVMDQSPTIIESFDLPNKQGTVALGYYEVNGERYTYRAVRWTPRKCEKANIIANKAGGRFDFDILANKFEVEDLFSWGFRPFELGISSEVDCDKLWQGMPEFENEAIDEYKAIKVHFLTQKDYKDFASLIGQNLTDRTRSIWYPKQYFDSMNKDFEYDES